MFQLREIFQHLGKNVGRMIRNILVSFISVFAVVVATVEGIALSMNNWVFSSSSTTHLVAVIIGFSFALNAALFIAIIEGLRVISGLIGDVARVSGEAVRTVGGEVVKRGSGLVEIAQQRALALSQNIGEGVQPGAILGTLAATATGALASATQGGQGVAGLIGGAVQNLPNVGGVVGGLAQNLPNVGEVVGGIAQNLPNVGGAVGGLAQNLPNVGGLAQNLPGVVGGLAQNLPNVGELAQNLPGVVGGLAQNLPNVGGVVSGLGTFAQALPNMADVAGINQGTPPVEPPQVESPPQGIERQPPKSEE